MRRSSLQHPLAVLRTRLGLGQTEFGDKVGRHWRTIQSIELGKLPLSEKLAERICEETGVNFKWLMKGNAEAAIIDERGLPWKPELFFDAQGKKLLPGGMLGRHYAVDLLAHTVAELCAAVVAATKSRNVRAYGWRLSNGIAKSVDDLATYPALRQEFMDILAGQFKNTDAALTAVIGEALQEARQWREVRGKKKAKR
jgi:hypothetical protein